jgi:GAF domain-containing protein
MDGPLLAPARLEAVAASGLVDSGTEQVFDDLASLAARLLEAPLAFVTVVDGERSWWKSCIGVAADGPRSNLVEESFCQYVVGAGTELIVGDAAEDPRTRDNPSVREMGVRAWAGFPVRGAGGHVLGTFCVVDTEPRIWSTRDVEVLQTLASAVSREIELRATVSAVTAASSAVTEGEARLRALADQTTRLSESLQVSLLPALDPRVLGIAGRDALRAGEQRLLLGGDLFDVTRTPDGSLAFLIGDVSGHGAVPAAVGASLRAAWRALALTQGSSYRWIDGSSCCSGASTSTTSCSSPCAPGRSTPT